MKKLNRKLIPAFAMLLLSAVLMSTASFAWFSQNGAVTASGFSVKATAPAALWIAKDANADFKDNVSLTNDHNANKTALVNGAMNPVTDTFTEATNTTGDAAAWKFQTLKDTATYQSVNEAGKVNGKDITAAALSEAATTGTFYKTSFVLLLEGQHDNEKIEKKLVNATVTLTAPEGADGIYRCINVALATESGENGVRGSQIFTFDADLDDDNAVVAGGEKGKTICTIAAQEVITVYVYVWFEGEHDQCYNKNAQSLDAFGISLAFSTADVNA